MARRFTSNFGFGFGQPDGLHWILLRRHLHKSFKNIMPAVTDLHLQCSRSRSRQGSRRNQCSQELAIRWCRKHWNFKSVIHNLNLGIWFQTIPATKCTKCQCSQQQRKSHSNKIQIPSQENTTNLEKKWEISSKSPRWGWRDTRTTIVSPLAGVVDDSSTFKGRFPNPKNNSVRFTTSCAAWPNPSKNSGLRLPSRTPFRASPMWANAGPPPKLRFCPPRCGPALANLTLWRWLTYSNPMASHFKPRRSSSPDLSSSNLNRSQNATVTPIASNACYQIPTHQTSQAHKLTRSQVSKVKVTCLMTWNACNIAKPNFRWPQ